MVEEYQGNTYSVMSLVMGILSILLFPLIGWIPGLIGLMVSRRSPGERGESLAVAGRICSIVGISLSAMSIIIVVAGLVLFSFRQGY